jgi:hypothetical protein
MSHDWPMYPVVAAGLAILQLEARLEHAAWRNGKLLFRFPLLFRALLIGAAGALAYYGHRDWSREVWWVNLLWVIVTICFLLGWPPTVVISTVGIERRFWWKPRISIPWEQVVDAEINQDGDMTIIGMEASIACSRFQNDPERFQKEVLHRSKLKKFSHPQRFTSLNL